MKPRPTPFAAATSTLAALARRPDLWLVAGKSGVGLIPEHWWRRRPYLPLPDRAWVRFRLSTAYGGDGSLGSANALQAQDVITWLEWKKAFPN